MPDVATYECSRANGRFDWHSPILGTFGLAWHLTIDQRSSLRSRRMVGLVIPLKIMFAEGSNRVFVKLFGKLSIIQGLSVRCRTMELVSRRGAESVLIKLFGSWCCLCRDTLSPERIAVGRSTEMVCRWSTKRCGNCNQWTDLSKSI